MSPADVLPPDVLSGERDELTEEEGERYFRAVVQHRTGMSLEEFCERADELPDWGIWRRLKEEAGLEPRGCC